MNELTITTEVRSLRDLSPQQWKSGIAAWLGWMFDGLDMHLYTLVALVFVAQLSQVTTDPQLQTEAESSLVKERGAWIQAAFLVGWALGGGFFGVIADRIGRSRALMLTILTYACFTGVSYLAQEWWHLLLFRFLAALALAENGPSERRCWPRLGPNAGGPGWPPSCKRGSISAFSRPPWLIGFWPGMNRASCSSSE